MDSRKWVDRDCYKRKLKKVNKILTIQDAHYRKKELIMKSHCLIEILQTFFQGWIMAHITERSWTFFAYLVALDNPSHQMNQLVLFFTAMMLQRKTNVYTWKKIQHSNDVEADDIQLAFSITISSQIWLFCKFFISNIFMCSFLFLFYIGSWWELEVSSKMRQ